MRAHTLHANGAHLARPDRRWVMRVVRFALNRFLLLPLGALVAVIWANTDGESYFRFAHAARFPVNEISMAVFLGLVAQELYEDVMPGGALRHWRHWGTSVLGAMGGVIGSSAAFFLFIRMQAELVLAPAWPVAAAVDIAAGYFVLRLIYPRRAAIVSFVVFMAVFSDAIALVTMTALAPGVTIHPTGLLLVLLALGVAVMLRRLKVAAFWPYWIGSGALSWAGLYWMGIHPALALIPIVPLLPHEPWRGEVFADRPADDPVHMAEHEWNEAAQIALFLFGLVNAGVILRHADTGTWAVIIAAMIGRPLGIVTAAALAMNAGLRLPGHMKARDLIVAALATTSGFTFALFLGSAALPIGAVAEQITVGALATVTGAVVTLGAAWALSAGRFKRPA